MALRTKSGASAYNTRDPSSGGNGIILNIKNPRLTSVLVEAIVPSTLSAPGLKIAITANDKNANSKLVESDLLTPPPLSILELIKD